MNDDTMRTVSKVLTIGLLGLIAAACTPKAAQDTAPVSNNGGTNAAGREALALAQTLEKEKKVDEAFAAAIKAVEADPDSIAAHEFLASFPERRLEESLEEPNFYAVFAALQPKLKAEHDQLAAQYKVWLRVYPNSVGVMYGMGTQLHNQEKPEARDYLLKVVEHDPANAKALAMLADVALMAGDVESERDYLRKAIALEPNNANYAFTYADAAEPAEREAALQDVLKRFPNTKAAATALAALSAAATDDAHRIQYLEQLRTQFPPTAGPGGAARNAQMAWLFEVYVHADPAKALELAAQMQAVKRSAEEQRSWQDRAEFAQAFIEANSKLAAGEGRDALALLDKLKPREGSSIAAMVERVKARVMAEAGQVRAAYALLLGRQAKTPEDETRAILETIGKQLRKTPAQVRVDVERAIYASATPAPAFELLNYATKEPMSLADFRGKVVLLTFWFPGCAPCAAEFPHFESVLQGLRKEGHEISYVSINIFPDQDAYVLPRIEKKKYTFIPLKGTEQVQDAKKGYAVTGAPTNFIIDRSGKIVYRDFMISGPEGEVTLRRMIESVL